MEGENHKERLEEIVEQALRMLKDQPQLNDNQLITTPWGSGYLDRMDESKFGMITPEQKAIAVYAAAQQLPAQSDQLALISEALYHMEQLDYILPQEAHRWFLNMNGNTPREYGFVWFVPYGIVMELIQGDDSWFRRVNLRRAIEGYAQQRSDVWQFHQRNGKEFYIRTDDEQVKVKLEEYAQTLLPEWWEQEQGYVRLGQLLKPVLNDKDIERFGREFKANNEAGIENIKTIDGTFAYVPPQYQEGVVATAGTWLQQQPTGFDKLFSWMTRKKTPPPVLEPRDKQVSIEDPIDFGDEDGVGLETIMVVKPSQQVVQPTSELSEEDRRRHMSELTDLASVAASRLFVRKGNIFDNSVTATSPWGSVTYNRGYELPENPEALATLVYAAPENDPKVQLAYTSEALFHAREIMGKNKLNTEARNYLIHVEERAQELGLKKIPYLGIVRGFFDIEQQEMHAKLAERLLKYGSEDPETMILHILIPNSYEVGPAVYLITGEEKQVMSRFRKEAENIIDARLRANNHVPLAEFLDGIVAEEVEAGTIEGEDEKAWLTTHLRRRIDADRLGEKREPIDAPANVYISPENQQTARDLADEFKKEFLIAYIEQANYKPLDDIVREGLGKKFNKQRAVQLGARISGAVHDHLFETEKGERIYIAQSEYEAARSVAADYVAALPPMLVDRVRGFIPRFSFPHRRTKQATSSPEPSYTALSVVEGAYKRQRYHEIYELAQGVAPEDRAMATALTLSANLRSYMQMNIGPSTYKGVWNNFKGQSDIYARDMPDLDEARRHIVKDDIAKLQKFRDTTQQERLVPDPTYRHNFATRIDRLVGHFEPMLAKTT